MRRRSSGFCPKPSPSETPSTRINSTGMARRMIKARGSRRNSRSSFLAIVQIGMSSLVAQSAPREVEKNAFEVRLLGLQSKQRDIPFVQRRHELKQRALDVAALQLERPAV